MKFFVSALFAAAFFAGGCEMVVPEKSHYPVPQEAQGKVVFIPTFDDGPIDQKFVQKGVYPKNEQEMLASLHKTLATLKKHNMTAVFYAVYIQPEKDAPEWSPKSSEEKMRKVFFDGLQAIVENGHAVAIHASNHDEYHNLFMSEKDAKEDLTLIISELDRSGYAYYPTWRVPYGGMRTLMNEQNVARRMKLPVETWLIDSNDWTTNHDSTDMLKTIFRDDRKWANNVEAHLRQDISVSKIRKEAQRDILFHISERTSSFLDEFLDVVTTDGKKVYGARFAFIPLEAQHKEAMLTHYLNSRQVNKNTQTAKSK